MVKRLSQEEIEKNDETIEIIDKNSKFLDKPNFYAILPAFVRYDKRLRHIERLIYAEISALVNKDGYCFATNGYFAKNYANSDRTISRAITNLTKLGYIFVVTEIVTGRELRKIYVVPMNENSGGTTNLSTQGGQKCLTSTSTIVRSTNSTKVHSTNSTISTNNTVRSTAPAEAAPDTIKLPSWLGNNSHARLASIYERLWLRHYGTTTKVQLKTSGGVIFRKLMQEYSEPMVGLMLLVHFEWKGASGTDKYFLERLSNAGFPLTWIPTTAPLYAAFIKNNLGISTDAEALAKVESALKQVIKEEGNVSQ